MWIWILLQNYNDEWTQNNSLSMQFFLPLNDSLCARNRYLLLIGTLFEYYSQFRFIWWPKPLFEWLVGVIVCLQISFTVLVAATQFIQMTTEIFIFVWKRLCVDIDSLVFEFQRIGFPKSMKSDTQPNSFVGFIKSLWHWKSTNDNKYIPGTALIMVRPAITRNKPNFCPLFKQVTSVHEGGVGAH